MTLLGPLKVLSYAKYRQAFKALNGWKKHPVGNKYRMFCPQGHGYSGENLYLRKEGWRMCKVCTRAATRRARLRAKAA
jgi:hypothetical protein